MYLVDLLIVLYNMDRKTCITVHVYYYTILNNVNSVMYHEPRHDLYYTGNTIITELKSIYINSTLKTKYFGDLCCKISINVITGTCNINMSILASIHINKYLEVNECLLFKF